MCDQWLTEQRLLIGFTAQRGGKEFPKLCSQNMMNRHWCAVRGGW